MLERLFERMSQQFDEASEAWESGRTLAWWSEGESLPIDLLDSEGEFVVTVDLPGFERDDVDVTVTEHTLRIEAGHEQLVDQEEGTVLRHERHHEFAQRSVPLPEKVDTDDVTARMKNGVLTITLPRAEAEAARKIDIDVE